MTRLLSNVLKRGSAVYQEERIIDYNEILKEKVRTMAELSERNRNRMDADGFVNGLEAEVIEETDYIDSDDTLEASSLEDDTSVSVEQANIEAQEIIQDANEQAQSILADAQDEAENIKLQSKEQGYQEGIAQAQSEFYDKEQALEQDYVQKKQALEEEYNQLKAQIEPDLVNVLVDVFAKVTKTIAEDNKDVVLHLVNNVLENVEPSHEITIKVSPDDYQFMVNNQGKIYCAMTADTNLEIIQDTNLQSSECLIETDSGVFNCSLDIELNNLIKEIKLLSCI